tara:strand:- start:111 stop:1895 length:1785 start_codon:yes stop_codon:yes gene_type:complete
MAIFQTVFFCLVIYTSIIGYGYIFKKITNLGSFDHFDIFVNGILLIVFLSLLINFFLPLNLFITNTFLILTSIFGLVYLIFQKKYFIEVIILILFSSLILFKSYSYNDYHLYHLPYMEILNNFKIIFGLSNLQFRFGHSSILQNISAFFYNSLMLKDSYIFFTPLLISIILIKSFKIFIKTNSKSIILLSFIFLFYFLIHANRYGALGNDYPSHGLAILIFLIYLIGNETNDKHKINTNFYQILSLSVLCFLSKLSFLLIFIFPILFLIKNFNVIKIYKKYLVFIVTSVILFFIKNLINTSCIIFPIYATCVDTDWLPNKYSEYSATYVSVVSEAAVKDYQNSGMFYADKEIDNVIELEKIQNKELFETLNPEEQTVFIYIVRYGYYNKLKNWIYPYYENHFKNNILKKLIPFICFVILINLIFIYFSKSKKRTYNFEFITDKPFFYLTFINLFFVIFWFFKFPIVRYGMSFILVISTFIVFLILSFFEIDNKKFKKYIKVFIFVILFFSITDNFVRIYNFKSSNNYNTNIVPLEKINYKKYNYNNKYIINLTDSVCGTIDPFCINSGDFKRFNREFVIDDFLNYIFILNQRSQ